jgi:hypothetical protein
MADALRMFRSCNRNFVRAEADAPSKPWCGVCPKCAFTALITAPFLARAESVSVFGSDILDAQSSVDHLGATLGLEHARPWDCVGAARETAAALHHLASAPRWADARAVRKLAPIAASVYGAKALDDAWEESFQCSRKHNLPRDLAWLCEDEAQARHAAT